MPAADTAGDALLIQCRFSYIAVKLSRNRYTSLDAISIVSQHKIRADHIETYCCLARAAVVREFAFAIRYPATAMFRPVYL